MSASVPGVSSTVAFTGTINARYDMPIGTDRTTALLEAGHKRARPIVMTTVAMIAGMLPVALQLLRGETFRSSMSIAVMGALITSTALTLVIVPRVSKAPPHAVS